MKKKLLLTIGLTTVLGLSVSAQSVKLKGIGHNNRYDSGDSMESTWIGSLYDENGNYTGKTAFIVEQGIYAMEWDGSSLTAPTKEPAVVLSDIKQGSQVDYEKAVWASNFNLMCGNSGAAYVKGKLYTVFSRDESSNVDDELFRVCKWDAVSGNLLSNEIRPKSDRLESAGMSYNPKDGKVYGLFYLTGQDLPAEITEDHEYFGDQDDDMTDGDAGYCLCTIDLETMKITPITKGLYYYNFITFAINSEGRAFALTSGGSNAIEGDDGKVRTTDNELAGAQLYEFNLETGNMYMNPVEKTDADGATYTDYVPTVGATGYCSQYRRQSACFSHSNPNKMYWNGYFNSGKGINDWGSWSTLSDKDWLTNGKYDTCLYEVDITTGEATLLSKIANRWTFSALWVDGDDPSDMASPEVDPSGINAAKSVQSTSGTQLFNLQGQPISGAAKGMYIVKQGDKTRKVMMR